MGNSISQENIEDGDVKIEQKDHEESFYKPPKRLKKGDCSSKMDSQTKEGTSASLEDYIFNPSNKQVTHCLLASQPHSSGLQLIWQERRNQALNLSPPKYHLRKKQSGGDESLMASDKDNQLIARFLQDDSFKYQILGCDRFRFDKQNNPPIENNIATRQLLALDYLRSWELIESTALSISQIICLGGPSQKHSEHLARIDSSARFSAPKPLKTRPQPKVATVQISDALWVELQDEILCDLGLRDRASAPGLPTTEMSALAKTGLTETTLTVCTVRSNTDSATPREGITTQLFNTLPNPHIPQQNQQQQQLARDEGLEFIAEVDTDADYESLLLPVNEPTQQIAEIAQP